jgi:hypothetical protein
VSTANGSRLVLRQRRGQVLGRDDRTDGRHLSWLEEAGREPADQRDDAEMEEGEVPQDPGDGEGAIGEDAGGA